MACTWILAIAALLGATTSLARASTAPATPTAFAGDRSVVLHWLASDIGPMHIERALAQGPFVRLTDQPVQIQGFADTAVTNHLTYRYRLVNAADTSPGAAASGEASIQPKPFANEDAFLDYVQRAAFAYFWHEANPRNGLIRDRSTPGSPASIAATGFGLTAITLGIDHRWIGREPGAERVLTTLQFFTDAPQSTNAAAVTGHRGWFYHFLNLHTGHRVWNCELSSVDTAWLLAGAVHAREYFDRPSATERRIRQLADGLLRAVDWQWMLAGGQTLSMGWLPERGFLESRWVGYNEAMWLYLLGLGTEGSGLDSRHWERWCQGYRWNTHHGYSYIEFAPLFGHQYSHCWIDFRGRQDAYLRGRGIDYFENSRRATLAQRAYCIANPGRFPGYGPLAWGLTACDGPGSPGFQGYSARGAPPPENDDGTLAPTAAGGSVPFAPEVCLPTLRHLYDTWRLEAWRPYGFCDAFNLKAGWWDPDVLGIDQGPILIMLENHRTGRVWRSFMRAPEVQRGLHAADFTRRSREP